jgi:GT2 family glycosyltransferase
MHSNVVISSSFPRRIDIIVPIYKNAELVCACVTSIMDHLHEIDSYKPRLVLINDSPCDEEVNALVRGFAASAGNLVVLSNENNLGFVRSVNRGLAQARCDGHDVLLVNSDTQTFPGTLSKLLEAVGSDPLIGFASPRSNSAALCSLPHYFHAPEPTAEQSYHRWLEISRTMPLFHFAPTAVGFYMYISHSVLANHGVLCEEFGVGYEEENDLVMRARKTGTRAIMVNHAFAYHRGSASFDLLAKDLSVHKRDNLMTLCKRHPEFMPLMKRYGDSAHFQAERLMAGLLKDATGRMKVVFDLSSMDEQFTEPNERIVAILRSMAERQSHRLHLTGIATADLFRFHGLDKLYGLHREEPGAHGIHGVALRMMQPLNLRDISTLEALAPINLFAILDTIAEDCGPLALGARLLDLWDHVAEQSNGLIFFDLFSEQSFCNRHPTAGEIPHWRCLPPTGLNSYPNHFGNSKRSHILVLGSRFAFDGAGTAASAIQAAFPNIKVVFLGEESREIANLSASRTDRSEAARMDRLFRDASVVVLASHVVNRGLMHALAANRPIVARRIPATVEILTSLKVVEGVYIFDHNSDLIEACGQALRSSVSLAIDSGGNSWDNWAGGLTDFILSIAARNDVFPRLVRRIKTGNALRRGVLGSAQGESHADVPAAPGIPGVLSNATAVDLKTLLALDSRPFVEHAYATLLCRPADEAGLQAYLSELQLGAHKVDILAALSSSSEGRLRGVNLRGLDEIVARRRNALLPLLRRIFGA